MTYEIGQKIETPFGIGTIIRSKPILYARDVYKVEIKTKDRDYDIWFTQGVLKPYKTAHDRLIEMGFELVTANKLIYITYDDLTHFVVDKERKELNFHIGTVDLELSRILTQYLEELNEKWLAKYTNYLCYRLS